MSREIGMMHYNEFRLPGDTSLQVQAEIHLNDKAAVRAGRKLANGKRFEVLRGSERVWPKPT